MVLNLEITIGDILTLVGLIIAYLGLFFTWYSIHVSNKQKRAELLLSLYDSFVSDNDMISIYYKIEYNKFKYNHDEFHESIQEKQLDKLLKYFDSIAKLWELNVLTTEDIKIISYEIVVTYRNIEINKYLSFLDKVFEERKATNKPFSSFRKLGAFLEKRSILHSQVISQLNKSKT